MAIVTVFTSNPAYAQANPQADAAGTHQTALVHFAQGTPLEKRDAVIAEMGGELVTWMPQIDVAEVRLPGQGGMVLASSAEGVVTFAESDMVVEAAGAYNDPDLSDASMNYGLKQVHAMDAWNLTTGSQDIIIAVVDSGIMLDHPEFAGRLVPGYDFVNHDDRADDDMGHGTQVAGIIAAALNNGQGVAGVCPNCRLMPVKVLNQNNLGSWSQLSQGILFAVDHGARVINLSLGASVSSDTLALAIQYAEDHGVIVVAAAGNSSSDAPFYPAALPGVIGVGATTSTDELWSRSNYGNDIDLVAPGSLVFSTYNDLNNMYHGYTFMSGTSMATPFVSGVAGLLLSANHDLTAQQVTDVMVGTANDLGSAGWDSKFGNGLVNAKAALMSPTVGLVGNLGGVASPAQRSKLYMPALGNN
jgi:thermitase